MSAYLTRRRRIAAAAACSIRLPAARATPEEMEAAIRAFAGEAPVLPGRVRLDIPPLVENGNAVPSRSRSTAR